MIFKPVFKILSWRQHADQIADGISHSSSMIGRLAHALREATRLIDQQRQQLAQQQQQLDEMRQSVGLGGDRQALLVCLKKDIYQLIWQLFEHRNQTLFGRSGRFFPALKDLDDASDLEPSIGNTTLVLGFMYGFFREVQGILPKNPVSTSGQSIQSFPDLPSLPPSPPFSSVLFDFLGQLAQYLAWDRSYSSVSDRDLKSHSSAKDMLWQFWLNRDGLVAHEKRALEARALLACSGDRDRWRRDHSHENQRRPYIPGMADNAATAEFVASVRRESQSSPDSRPSLKPHSSTRRDVVSPVQRFGIFPETSHQ